MDEINITIIGAGVIGLAVAVELSKQYENILVLEKEESFGRQTSSRNSEVIHSGIYYPTGSLKTKLCVRGARLLYEYCRYHDIGHSKTGKLIVASEEDELTPLDELFRQGVANGIENLSVLGETEILRLEPGINALAAIYSPNTGIIDSHVFMKKLYNQASSQGVLFSFGNEVNRICQCSGGYELGVKGDDYCFFSRMAINCGGLFADRVARLAGIDTGSAGYDIHLCKGTYFSYSGLSPVKRLIYPLPEKGLSGLGVHATLNLAGYLKFGPDVEYVDKIDYSIDANKKEDFYKSASKIIKDIRPELLNPDMSGIRPKLSADGFRDFVVKHESDRGMDGLINLIGIESPGLTASMAIAERVTEIVNNFLK